MFLPSNFKMIFIFYNNPVLDCTNICLEMAMYIYIYIYFLSKSRSFLLKKKHVQ